MSSLTPNYNFILPAVNSPVDEDLWGDELNDNWSSIDTLLKTVSDATQLPIGSLYLNADVATNPASLLGYGTWIAFATGRVLIGVGSGTDSNGEVRSFTAGETGGEYKHELTEPELAEHYHEIEATAGGTSGTYQTVTEGGATGAGIVDTENAGDGDGHNNVQPYIAVYIWKRSA